jgi:small GTP-binding protein
MFLKAKSRNNDLPGRRVVVLGAAGVGKSSIVTRFVYDEFIPDYMPTVEDFYHTDLLLHGRKLPLDIVDMTGHYSFPAMKELAIACADAFVLVFNVNDEQSFRELSAIRDLIFQVKGDTSNAADIPIVVVGNMVDLSNRCSVEKITMECLVTIDWNHSYVETSAKTNYNIRRVFDEVLVRSKISGVSTPSSRRKCVNWTQKGQSYHYKDNKCTLS